MKEINLRHSTWFGDKSVKIYFPEHWSVSTYAPRTTVALPPKLLEMKIDTFLSRLNLSDINSGEQVALIVDDISRPTPLEPVLKMIGRKLQESNINRRDIKVIVAGGTHKRLSQELLERKLGREILDQYQVSSHNSKRNLVYLGKTQNATPLYVNRIVYKSRLKIGIGGAYPHAPAGFGGGAKIILGISGFRTIAYLHKYFYGVSSGGKIENDFRKELESIADLVKLTGSVHIMINQNREIVEMFCGDFIQSHLDAVNFNKSLFQVPSPSNADIVVINTYPFDTTLLYSKKGWWPKNLSPANSTNIIIGAYPLGAGSHGLYTLSPSILIRILKKIQINSKLPAQRVLNSVFNKATSLMKREENNKQISTISSKRKTYFYRPEALSIIDKDYGFSFYQSWDTIIESLQNEYRDCSPNVVIYPCAPIQFLID